jgi:histidyl-tRNA synthetase
MFRYERPQAGRFRQFYQIGVEAMGSPSPAIDAEVMTLLIEFFKELGLSDLELQINSLGCKECRPQYREILKSAIQAHLGELCSNCNQRYERNPLRVLDCKVPRDGEIAKDLPKIKNHLCNQCEEDFAQVQKFLDAIKTPYTVNDQIVRGLDYYNKTTFEVIAKTGLGSQNAVFALGMERLISILPEEKLQGLELRPDIYLVSLGEEAQQLAFKITHQLRAVGLYVEREIEGGSMKSQMRKANKMSSRFTLIVGENEIKNKQYMLKNMDDGEQWEVAADNLAKEVQSRLKSLE